MNKAALLKEFLRERTAGGIALAFSGGVDSALLLSVLRELRDEQDFPLAALTMHSLLQRPEELAAAERLAQEYAVKLEVFPCDPLTIAEVRTNTPERCYACKRYFFGTFRHWAQNHGMAVLIDGTNADDLTVFRPGRAALAELGVVSPLAELGIGKADIRRMAHARNIPCAGKPSLPCLATRFAYNTLLTPESVAAAGKGEELLRRFVPENSDVRLRIHADIARIEVSPEAMAAIMAHGGEIAAGLHALGFAFAALDLDGFRSGSFDGGRKNLPL